ncbi:MAG: hypothetical protein KGD60_08800 [Candidatus Thorarchaeota archaeon]|nr:hypothetical protein [Candidatus Thorarchaeota archaeon]
MVGRHSVAIGAGLLVLFIAVLSPFIFITSFGRDGQLSVTMYTLLWYWSIGPSGSIHFYLHDAWAIVQYLPFVGFRFPFAYLMMRYYEGKTTGERLILAGILGEVPPYLVSFSLHVGPFFSQIIGPLPLHLLAGLILVKLRPPPTITSPWEVHE